MRCLYITQEYAPYFTEGGLGLTSRALPAALQVEHDLMHDLVLPAYPRLITEHGLRTIEVHRLPAISLGGVTADPTVLRLLDHGGPCDVYLIAADNWYDRNGMYRDSGYRPFADEVERAAFFGWCVANWIDRSGATYDLVHGNDWQSGAALAHLRTRRRADSPALLMNIHSAVYEGDLARLTADPVHDLALPQDAVTRLREHAPGRESLLVLGLLSADAAVTCSPTYARELPQIHGDSVAASVWARMAHTGIVSGVDGEIWDPSAAGRSAVAFDQSNVAEGKSRNKAILQRRLGLHAQPDVPVLGVCSRFVYEKGVDLLLGALAPLLAEGRTQAVLMGPAVEPYRGALADLVAAHPQRAVHLPRFHQDTAWLIYAGSDLTVMPSRVEPCGLNQLIAMAYGTLPVVSPVGGLNDTVVPVGAGDGSGWIVPAHTSQAVLDTMREALAFLQDQPDRVNELRCRLMGQDWSWARTANDFAELYRGLVMPRAAAPTPSHRENA
ncbi:glycogen synthase [Salinispora oceanensis]|uniref:glycogen synthase n=1 Tax=Salinispora oceanensis TaxID=1050199 RepID=UPI000368A0A5|nr:glycogen/starch synthase [Salinispora oceanensis]